MATGCGSVGVVVRQPNPVTPPPPGGFRAGAAETDITPPPGLPVWGSSIEASGSVKGYHMRLFTRAIVLEDSRGERVALVQTDLGAVSGLLHRTVASKLSEYGLGPDRLLIAATHTHGAPGGYFGAAFYNKLAAARRGFDPELLKWLAERTVQAVAAAASSLAPARIAAGELDLSGFTKNRSLDAWKENPGVETSGSDCASVDCRVRLLRVDVRKDSEFVPLAAFVVFAAHGTAAGIKQPLYHGDLQAAAAELLRHRVPKAYPDASRFIAAFVNGAEGDVSPGWPPWQKQDFARAKTVGSALADKAFEIFRTLDGRTTEVSITHAYREAPVPNAEVPGGQLCDRAIMGVPALGGAEDGRSFLYGWLSIKEGSARKPRGCQGTKRTGLGFIQYLVAQRDDFPLTLPFQVIRLGDVMTLVSVPGEPTTETGRSIRAATLEAGVKGVVAVVGLANEYVGYVATPAEYDVQHYEGASTLYGRLESLFVRNQIDELVKSTTGTPITGYPLERNYFPGGEKSFWGDKTSCRSGLWKPLDVRKDGGDVFFSWKGLARGE
ncbi:MAG: neutral/alkaline non-lysosomal ceramidase N-terminal domain-containing protein, partial [Acidobacteriota bacterium]|nr:neutral/alkaline non-lysosomal ceramidase N-terminal domain-containing protein [Acidobacteriota bacterium]